MRKCVLSSGASVFSCLPRVGGGYREKNESHGLIVMQYKHCVKVDVTERKAENSSNCILAFLGWLSWWAILVRPNGSWRLLRGPIATSGLEKYYHG